MIPKYALHGRGVTKPSAPVSPRTASLKPTLVLCLATMCVFVCVDGCVWGWEVWVEVTLLGNLALLYPPIGVVFAHRRILGIASVVCVLVKICVSSISLYKLDTDKLTAPFGSAHQFTLVCTVSDSKTVQGCHYNLLSNHSFVLTD